MIHLKEVSKSYHNGEKTIKVLDNINLHLKEKAINVITGPSGSGKSTLLNLIGCLVKADHGEINIDGKNITSLTEIERAHLRGRKIGFVFQEFYLKPELTVSENILLPIYFTNTTITQSELTEMLKEVELEHKENQKIKELSGGQKQRVAIARALINKPKILIADEPTGNLDQKTGQTIIQLFKKIHKTLDTTIIIATHDEEITKIADTIFHLNNGKIQ